MSRLGLLPLLLVFAAGRGSLDDVVVKAAELPPGWSFVESIYSKSLDAADFYSNYDVTYARHAGARLEEKTFQSFASPAGRGTVYYLRFASDADARKVEQYAGRILWGGRTPAANRTERLFVLGATVVIVSSGQEDVAEKLEKLLR